MSRRRVVVLSRQGSASLDAGDRQALEDVADVDYHALRAAPGRRAAVGLLAEADLLAATNVCLPIIDSLGTRGAGADDDVGGRSLGAFFGDSTAPAA